VPRRLTFRWTSEDLDGFEWSETNSAAHFAKHGIDFRVVGEVDWSRVMKAPDLRRRYATPRWVGLCYCPRLDRVLVIVYVRANRIARIISVREANGREEEIFDAGRR